MDEHGARRAVRHQRRRASSEAPALPSREDRLPPAEATHRERGTECASAARIRRLRCYHRGRGGDRSRLGLAGRREDRCKAPRSTPSDRVSRSIAAESVTSAPTASAASFWTNASTSTASSVGAGTAFPAASARAGSAATASTASDVDDAFDDDRHDDDRHDDDRDDADHDYPDDDDDEAEAAPAAAADDDSAAEGRR